MLQWTADFTNDPNNDYELMIEILCNGEDIGVIKREKSKLTFILFAHGKDLAIPFNWLLGIMNEANKNLSPKKIWTLTQAHKYHYQITNIYELGFDILTAFPILHW